MNLGGFGSSTHAAASGRRGNVCVHVHSTFTCDSPDNVKWSHQKEDSSLPSLQSATEKKQPFSGSEGKFAGHILSLGCSSFRMVRFTPMMSPLLRLQLKTL